MVKRKADDHLVVGNWKSHFTASEATGWLERYGRLVKQLTSSLSFTPALCVPYTVLYPMAKMIKDSSLPLCLGVQDISPFEEGSYTGEISGRMVRDLAGLVLIGHSERKRWLAESPKLVQPKITMALRSNLTPILCAARFGEIPSQVRNNPKVIVMYEPPTAISQGGRYRPASPDRIRRTIDKWRAKLNLKIKLFYGGSVNPENVTQLFLKSGVEGVVPGHASLKPESFVALIREVNSLHL